MSFNDQSVREFHQLVSQARRVLVASHMNPDGDAFGSCLAVSHYLDGLGIDHEVLNHDDKVPFSLRFLPGVERIRKVPLNAGADLAIVLDLDNLTRLGEDVRVILDQCDHMVVIDHHVPRDQPGDVRLVDTGAASTTLLLYRIFRQLQTKLTPAMATCLLAGIVTDTGSFRYQNTSIEALEAAAQLVAMGGALHQVAEESYMRKPLATHRLLGRTLEKMKLDHHNRLAWAVLTTEDFLDCGATEENSEGLANELLSIETVDIAAVLRHPPERKMRASLRSRGPYDVATVANDFAGGGHRNAAGCTFETSLEEAESALIAALKRCLASS